MPAIFFVPAASDVELGLALELPLAMTAPVPVAFGLLPVLLVDMLMPDVPVTMEAE
jgi:hypothetical protein